MSECAFLFLDIEGVLNSHTFLESNRDRLTKREVSEHPAAFIDPEAVDVVNRIINQTTFNPKIVVTSTWRHTFSVEKLNQILAKNGFDDTVDDTTPLRSGRLRSRNGRVKEKFQGRGIYIQRYLSRQARSESEIEHVVIIDNLPPHEMVPVQHYLVQTNPKIGLENHHINEVLGILNSPFQLFDC